MRIDRLDVEKGYDEDWPDDKLSFFRHLDKGIQEKYVE